jgi:hypothetical protein
MIKKINSLLNLIAQTKVYFSNAGIYLSIANFIMILATFKLAYKISISAYILVPAGFLLVLLIGYLDYRLIFLKQTQHINKRNDIKHQLNRIEKKLEQLENK